VALSIRHPDFRQTAPPEQRPEAAAGVDALGPDEVRTLRVVPADAGDLRARLTRSAPDLAARRS
jgi:hypothetical protein